MDRDSLSDLAKTVLALIEKNGAMGLRDINDALDYRFRTGEVATALDDLRTARLIRENYDTNKFELRSAR
jgi:hypothetical protein